MRYSAQMRFDRKKRAAHPGVNQFLRNFGKKLRPVKQWTGEVMRQVLEPQSRDVVSVMTAIIAVLEESWPHAVHISPTNLPAPAAGDLFLKAALALQDEGAIMYEAMLVDGGVKPSLRDAMLTRKGQQFYGPAR